MTLRSAFAVTLLLLGTGIAPAQFVLDTEPDNNTASGADALPLPGTGALVNIPSFGQENDIDFFQASLGQGEVLFGMLTGMQDLFDTFDIPDTQVSALRGDTRLTANDDDEAEEYLIDGTVSFGRGSLFRLQADQAADYLVAATGSGDDDFDGTGNTQQGYYALTVGRLTSLEKGGDFLDTDPDNDFISGADLISIGPGEAKVAVGQLEPRGMDTAADTDFFSLGSLAAGLVLNVMTAPLAGLDGADPNFDVPDTVIGLFNAQDAALVGNDDAPFVEDRFAPLYSDNPVGSDPLNSLYGSAFRVMIPEDGEYFLGVTGSGDADFVGDHFEEGNYGLLVSLAVVPEPSSGLLLLGSVGVLLAGRRRWCSR
jgi:hypothetical protein